MINFVSHFSQNKKSNVDEKGLYEMTKRKDKPICKYFKRFNDAEIALPDYRKKTAITAFIKV